MTFKLWKAILACSAITAAAVALPAAASATSWVSEAKPSAPYNSCAHPAYNHIQQAIEAPTTTIHVCGTSYGTGIYEEQLTIERPVTITGYEGATVKLPAKPADSTTACDKAADAYEGQANQDLVSICTPGTATITLSDLTFEAYWPEGTCYESLYGILVAGEATLKATGVTMDGAGAKPIDGCQGGVGIQVGMAWTTPVEIGHATLTNDTVTNYQKNGITVDGTGSSATITTATVTGAGPTEVTAQNGIQVSNGSKSVITKSTITGNECNLTIPEPKPGQIPCGSNSLEDYQATGVLFYGAAEGSNVNNSTIDGNDIGVYAEDALPSEPEKSQVVVSGNTLKSDRYESVVISQGWATVGKNTISEGNVGIQLLQYGGEKYGPKGTGSGDTITGMTNWAVQGYSDDEPSDPFGTFTINSSKISGNPGVTVAGSVNSNNIPKLKIFTNKTDS